MSKQTKAQLQQEIIDLQLKINNLESQLLNNLKVDITSTNTTLGAPLPTQNKNTNGIHNSDERVRKPLHQPDQPDPDTLAPSYNQLAEIARLIATFNYRPTIKVASMQSASLYIQDFHKHLNALQAKDKPWRQYTITTDGVTIKLYGDDYKSAIGLQQTCLLNTYLTYFKIPNPNDMKEEN